MPALDFREFVHRWQHALAHLDPRRAAWRRMEAELTYGRHRGPAPPHAKPAAVIALFYPQHDRWHVPLIVRPQTMSDHAGQVSFPGGSVDPGETIESCALRELHEELGVNATGLAVLGRLSPVYIFNSNFHVVPVVAAIAGRPDFRPNPAEVADLLEVPAAHFLDPQNYVSHTVVKRALTYRAPSVIFRDHRIWGATGLMLAELTAVLTTVFDPGPRPASRLL